jgi:periplasmic protein CpxP/Spy
MEMKLIVIVVLAAAMIGNGTGAALAGPGPGGDFGGPLPGMEMEAGSFEGRMAKALKLTDTQQSQIKTILDAEREQDKTLIDKMHESRKLLMQAAEATTFDEAAARVLAVDQAATETELVVSRTKVQSQIYALLTTEQRELLKNLRPDMDRQSPPPSDK